MAQAERRAKAVLAAAIALVEKIGDSGTDTLEFHNLREAVAKHKEATKALEKLEGKDPSAWTCPHCDAERPAFGWHFNIGDTGPFALQWVTVFCAECKTALTVNIVAFVPKPELAEQLKRQFAGKLHLA